VTADFADWPTTPGSTLEMSSSGISTADSFAAEHHCDLWSGISRIG